MNNHHFPPQAPSNHGYNPQQLPAHLQQPQQQQPFAPQQPPAQSAEPDLGRAMSVMVVLLVIAMVAVYYMAANQWHEPTTPMVALAIVGLLCGGMGILFSLPEDAELDQLSRAPKTFAPVAAGLVAGLVLGSGWMMEPIRQRGMNQAYARHWYKAQERGLYDPSSVISGVACRGMLHSPQLNHHTYAKRALIQRPEIAPLCLQDKTGRAERTATQAVSTWYNETQKGDPSLGCGRANAIALVAPFTEHSAPALMLCSANKAGDVKTRQCCADVLARLAGTGDALASAMRKAPESVLTQASASPMMAMSLHRGRLEDADKQVASTLNLSSPQAMGYALSIGCGELTRNPTTEIQSHFRSTTLRLCKVDHKASPSAIQLWSDTCEEVERQRATSKIPPAKLFCDRLSHVSTRNAVRRASKLVHAAKRTRDPSAMIAAIKKAWSAMGPLSAKQIAILRGLYRDSALTDGEMLAGLNIKQRAQLEYYLRKFGRPGLAGSPFGQVSDKQLAGFANLDNMEGIPGGNFANAMKRASGQDRVRLESALQAFEGATPKQRAAFQAAIRATQLKRPQIDAANAKLNTILTKIQSGDVDPSDVE